MKKVMASLSLIYKVYAKGFKLNIRTARASWGRFSEGWSYRQIHWEGKLPI